MAAYRNLNLTATTVEQFEPIKFDEIILIANDDTTNDLILSIGGNIAEGNYYILKAGEQLNNLQLKYGLGIYYKSSADTVSFRFYTILR